MPQFDFNYQRLVLGQIGTGTVYAIDSYQNELLAQESEVSVSGPAVAGTYSFDVIAPEGTFSVEFAATGGETPAQVVAGLLADLQGSPELLNIVVGTDASPDLELAFIHEGIEYGLAITSDPNSILTAATTQAAGGTRIDLGVGVVQGSDDKLATAPDAATTDADFLGFTVRSLDALVNDADVNSAGTPDGFEPGSTLSVMSKGDGCVEVEDAVAANGQVFMRIQNPNPLLGQKLGSFRSDAAGGDAIAITGARFRTSTQSRGLALIRVNRPS